MWCQLQKDIEIGDQVLAYNAATGENGSYTVTDVIVHLDSTLIHLILDGESIETTPEHPFYTLDRGWVDADKLYVGEYIQQANGTPGVVEAITVVPRLQVMYSLTVDVAHTFFVGDQQWLVHNTNCAGGCSGKQARLRELASDDKVSSAERGWLKQEINNVERGKRTTIRNPSGKDLAHRRGKEARKGYSYAHSDLQDRDLHRLQHKHEGYK